MKMRQSTLLCLSQPTAVEILMSFIAPKVEWVKAGRGGGHMWKNKVAIFLENVFAFVMSPQQHDSHYHSVIGWAPMTIPC